VATKRRVSRPRPRPAKGTTLAPKVPALPTATPTRTTPAPTLAPPLPPAALPLPPTAPSLPPAAPAAPPLAPTVPSLPPTAPPLAPTAPPLAPTAPPLAPTAPLLFSPTSIWNQPLAADTPVDPSSAGIVGSLLNFVNADVAAKSGPWINTTEYSTPIYTVPADQPTVPVYLDGDPALSSALSAVPIPSDALPAAGSDSEMTVYQPSSDTLWELFAMRQSLDPPASTSAVVSVGGGLAAGTYYYAVTALSSQGETTPGPVQSYTIPANGKVTITWTGRLGATGYNIYRGPDPQHLQLVQTIAHATTQLNDPSDVWTDDGSAPTSVVSPPTANTAATPGQWHAEWGGRILNESTSPGYYQYIQNATGGFSEQGYWGVTASGLPVAGGLITLADLASGHIDHAVAMGVPTAAAGAISFPAHRTDGVNTSPTAVPEGARFRLDPSLDLSKLNLPPITLMLAQAAQNYGLIVDDQTWSIVGFRAQDPTPLMRAGQPNPYLKYFTNPATGAYETPTSFLSVFPWSHLELVSPPQSP
jgi:hypothetical protein